MGGTRLIYLFESAPESNDLGMEENLSGKIKYDDPAVFRRLRVGDVQDELVVNCVAALRSEEEKCDSPDDSEREIKSSNHGRAKGSEMDMKESLVRLLNCIAKFNQNDPPRRTFYRTNSMLKPAEPHTFGFTSVSPEITISPTGDAACSIKWQDRDAFCVIRPPKKQRSIPTVDGELPGIVAQSAEYARLFMSLRPSMLYCVGILIFGTQFCVGIFDRVGITFSPIHDMFENLEIFVRVVHSLGWDLSIEELGHDPSVRALRNEVRELTIENGYPSSIISSFGNDSRQWCTTGPPICLSFLFLGRGTHIWYVHEYVEDNQRPHLCDKKMVMKTSWHNSTRMSESDMYLLIQQFAPKDLAKLEYGADVTMFCGPTQFPISVHNLRSADSDKIWLRELTDPTPVLHRLSLSTVVRPIWEYKSDLDLLSGIRGALEAHKALYEKGILHHDISAANVFLAESPSTGSSGFIADLDFARIGSSSIPETTPFELTDECEQDETIAVYGTAQFMARELLYCTTNTGDLVVHEAKHDVESFIWVLSYSAMRNLFMKASVSDSELIREQCGELGRLFRRAFCQQTLEEIAEQRQTESAIIGFPFALSMKETIGMFMTKALVDLFGELQNLIYFSSSRASHPLILTHDILLAKVNNAIALLL